MIAWMENHSIGDSHCKMEEVLGILWLSHQTRKNKQLIVAHRYNLVECFFCEHHKICESEDDPQFDKSHSNKM